MRGSVGGLLFFERFVEGVTEAALEVSQLPLGEQEAVYGVLGSVVGVGEGAQLGCFLVLRSSITLSMGFNDWLGPLVGLHSGMRLSKGCFVSNTLLRGVWKNRCLLRELVLHGRDYFVSVIYVNVLTV